MRRPVIPAFFFDMTRLSVNINKIATLRNSRGGNNPDVIQVALDCERFGAEGITVHPRPDERHELPAVEQPEVPVPQRRRCRWPMPRRC